MGPLVGGPNVLSMGMAEARGAKIMIFGAHVIVYSKDVAADRAFFSQVLGFSSVDAGGGWLIFALPPAEVAVHPAEVNDRHELFFVCADLKAEIAALAEKGVKCSEVQEERWGSISRIRLPEEASEVSTSRSIHWRWRSLALRPVSPEPVANDVRGHANIGPP